MIVITIVAMINLHYRRCTRRRAAETWLATTPARASAARRSAAPREYSALYYNELMSLVDYTIVHIYVYT